MRLDIERQKKLEPSRLEFAKSQIEFLGLTIVDVTDKRIRFKFKGSIITFFPYSGWHSGKGITDGRGWDKLYLQIKPRHTHETTS